MTAAEAIAVFLRHAADRDLPDADLFRLKARTFMLMADESTADGDVEAGRLCRAIAARASSVADDLELEIGR